MVGCNRTFFLQQTNVCIQHCNKNIIVHPKMKICFTFTHPQAIQNVDVCFFIWTDLEKFSITSLAHQWILCSEWVPSEWESKQLIKHHNNPQVIHTTPVHQLTSCEVKSYVFVRNKSINTFLSLKKWDLYP